MSNDDDVDLQSKIQLEKKQKKLIKATITKQKQNPWMWAIKVFVLSFALSIVFSIASEYFMSATGIILSMIIVLVLIAIAILSDLMGVAVTVASSEPFNSMSARKMTGAKEALLLIKNASKVSVICNDVIGDICGIVSGAAGAAIVGRITAQVANTNVIIMATAIASAIIAGLTISGKAIGKSYAMKHADEIVLFAGKLMSPISSKKEKVTQDKKATKKDDKSSK